MLNVSVTRKKSNLAKLINQLPQALEDGLKAALNETQQAAIDAKNLVIEYPSQILDSEIKVEIVADDVKGRVYTDGERVLFVEFGTGTLAEMPHVGTSRAFIESGYTMWLLPVSRAPMDYGADRIVTVGEYQYYIMFPTEPKHFFTNTAFNRRDENVEEIRQSVRAMIRGL